MIQRILRAYRRHGFIEFCRLILYNLVYFAARPFRRPPDSDDNFDRIHGTDTSGIREIGTLDIESDNARFAVRYQPTGPNLLLEILPQLRTDLSPFYFVDYGCGKGRMLLLASHFPFRRIIGIDFSPELVRIAQRNIGIYQSPEQRCTDLSVVCCDAATYEPPSKPIICYFYNPFGQQVMKRVIANLDESLRMADREAFIVYTDPRHSRVIEASDAWELLFSTGGCSVFQRRVEKALHRFRATT